MRRLRGALTMAIAAASLLAAASAQARVVRATDVRSPTGLITCWAMKYGHPGIECTAPYLPDLGELDTYMGLRPTRRAFLGQRGDYPGYGHRQVTVRYGDVWRRPGIRCTMRSSGMTCRNRSRHGFHLARGAVRRF